MKFCFRTKSGINRYVALVHPDRERSASDSRPPRPDLRERIAARSGADGVREWEWRGSRPVDPRPAGKIRMRKPFSLSSETGLMHLTGTRSFSTFSRTWRAAKFT